MLTTDSRYTGTPFDNISVAANSAVCVSSFSQVPFDPPIGNSIIDDEGAFGLGLKRLDSNNNCINPARHEHRPYGQNGHHPERVNSDDGHLNRNEKTSPPYLSFRFLDKHPLFQKRSRSPIASTSPLYGISPRNSSQTTVKPCKPLASHEPSIPRSTPRHVPIVISQDAFAHLVDRRPPSPPSSDTHSRSNSSSTLNRCSTNDERDNDPLLKTPKQSRQRARHIPIQIPAFAQPFGQFPPTPSASLDNTPRASFTKSAHSCEPIITSMSRPATSESKGSPFDSSNSTSPPLPQQQSFEDRVRPPAGGSYLADIHTSSESSLNQIAQDSPQLGADATTDRSRPDVSSIPQSQSPAPRSQTPGTVAAASTGSTNLSGLVCNVHKCTGREPHGLVGATTTILGDKLYVFGGRCLSKRRPYLTSEMHELDLLRRHWTKVPTTGDVPSPRYFHSVCALGDTKLVCYGGMSPAPGQVLPNGAPRDVADPNGEMAVMSDIHIYDAPTRSWIHIKTKETPPGRYAHCAAVLPSSAAFSSSNAPMSAIHHNPQGDQPNQGKLGVSLDGSGGAEMIVVGGQDSNNKYIDAISVFNLRNLQWTDTQSLSRSCGAYRSVVTPLTNVAPSRIGADADREEGAEASPPATDRVETTSAMLIYSNYNFLDVKLELQVRMPNGTLMEKSMKGPISPPGLRFPNGDVLDNHFIVSGTYLTSSKHEYALWALDLRTLKWSRIDAGGSIFSQGSWNRGILWSRRNTFVILGNRKRSLVDDYNHRRINFSNICMVELEAFGLYDNPRRTAPNSAYKSVSAPTLPPSYSYKGAPSIGRPLVGGALDLGTMAMNIRDLADMDLLAIGGERIPVNSHILARRWGPYFVKLLRDTNSSSSLVPSDAASSSDGGTLRPSTLNTAASLASRNSSITITPSITTLMSAAPSGTTVTSNTSASTMTIATSVDPPTVQNLPAPSRPRQLYLPHTLLTLRSLVHYLYTLSLPPPNHHLCTPQILCSLLQLARPYRIDGLLEATVERLHQILDGRNAAAVFNAAAMAAGGGRGSGALFGREGDDLVDEIQSGLTVTRMPARDVKRAQAGAPGQSDASESEAETGSEAGSVASSATSNESHEATSRNNSIDVIGTDANGDQVIAAVGDGEIWSGGVSCVVGLQKRGLRGLMEGRRIRENGRGGNAGPNGKAAIGRLTSPAPTGRTGTATNVSNGVAPLTGANVGLGIA